MTPGYSAYLSSYLPVLTVLVAGVLMVMAMLGASRLLRPTAPSKQKRLTYESGVDPVGSDWVQVHVRFYVFAFLYVIFAVDAVFLFPWATVFAGIGAAAVSEMAAFVAIVLVGLGYAGRTGVLTWT